MHIHECNGMTHTHKGIKAIESKYILIIYEVLVKRMSHGTMGRGNVKGRMECVWDMWRSEINRKKNT